MAAYPAARPTIPDVSQSPPNANKLGSASGTWHSNLHNLLADNLLAALDKIGYSASSPADIPILGSMLACDADGKSKWTSAITQGKVLVGTNGAPVVTNPSFVNLLTNGGFEIWQRGNGPFTANQAYAADRWQVALNGGDNLSVAKDTTHQAAQGLACAACTYTLSAGTTTVLQQPVEGADQLRGQTVSLSMAVSCATPNAVRLGLNVNGANVWGAYHPGDGAYHTLTVSAVAGAAITSAFVFAGFAASCTVYVDNAMLVVGSTPVNYIPLTPAEEWARCQRYYEVFGATASIEPSGAVGLCTSTTGAAMSLRYVRKAVVPTVTVSANSDWAVLNSAGGLVTLTGFSGVNIGLSTCALVVTVASGLVAGNATYMAANSTTNARLILEANP